MLLPLIHHLDHLQRKQVVPLTSSWEQRPQRPRSEAAGEYQQSGMNERMLESESPALEGTPDASSSVRSWSDPVSSLVRPSLTCAHNSQLDRTQPGHQLGPVTSCPATGYRITVQCPRSTHSQYATLKVTVSAARTHADQVQLASSRSFMPPDILVCNLMTLCMFSRTSKRIVHS